MGSNATKARAGVPSLGGAMSGLQEAEPALAASFPVRPFRYNSARHAWEKLDAAQVAAEAGAGVRKTSLRMVTYNVWFGNTVMRTRFKHILGMLAELDADVVCLQEDRGLTIVEGTANMEWIEEMTDNPYVQDNYWISDTNGRTIQGYGVVLLSRIPMVDLTMWRLPTRMGRSALIGTYKINDETVSIGTVHLESMDSAPLRAQQLEKIAGILSASPHAALMGDFNFDSERNFHRASGHSAGPGAVPLENDNIATHYPDYVDVWPTLRPEEKGLTFDSEVNRMIRQHEQMRYDRVIWKSAGGRWRPKHIELIGTEPMKGHLNVWPSDHFGLVADLEFVDEAPTDAQDAPPAAD